MRRLRSIAAVLLLALPAALANSHREAPTGLDRTAAITDFYAFVSHDDASKVTFIVNVDSAFEPGVVYAVKISNSGGTREDLSFEVRFGGGNFAVTMVHGTVRKDLAAAVAEQTVECIGTGMRAFAAGNAIALEVPAALVTSKGSPVIGTWAAAYRVPTTIRRTQATAPMVEIQRVGNPVAGGGDADLLRLDTSVPPGPSAGFPNGRRLTDDVMAIALHATPSSQKDPTQATFPYISPTAEASKTAAPDPKNVLAASYIQKLRETGDGSYLERASKILDGATNYEALRLRNEIALQLHEFAAVADQSRKLSAMSPQDPRNWGTLGDALMEMGEYDKAAEAYQQMVDLRPGLSSLNRVAFYRFVTGDADGAIAAMNGAIGAGSRIPENLAWCLVDLGWMYYKTGKTEMAAAAFSNALRVFPGYHRAYAGMGQTLAAMGKIPEAIEQYRAAQAVVPMPDYAAALAELYEISGNGGEGRKQRALLDMLDQIGMAKGETTNRNLAVVYADQDRKLDRALQLAQAELNSRKDVYTYDALSWALFKNGKLTEAAEASAKALCKKTAEPAFYYHAGMIAAAMQQTAPAKEYLSRALKLNPKFDLRQAALAEKTLAELSR